MYLNILETRIAMDPGYNTVGQSWIKAAVGSKLQPDSSFSWVSTVNLFLCVQINETVPGDWKWTRSGVKGFRKSVRSTPLKVF